MDLQKHIPKLVVTFLLTLCIGTTQSQSSDVITANNIQGISTIATLGRGGIDDVAWSADGSKLLIASSRGVFQYESRMFELDHFLPMSGVSDVTLAPDGGSWLELYPKTYYGYETLHYTGNHLMGNNLSEICVAGCELDDIEINGAAVSPDADEIAVLVTKERPSGSDIVVFDTTTQTGRTVSLQEFVSHSASIVGFKSGKVLVVDENVSASKRGALLVDVAAEPNQKTQHVPLTNMVLDGALSNDGQWALIASYVGNEFSRQFVGLWNTSNPQEQFIIHNNTVPAAFSPNSELLGTTGADGSVNVWSLSSRRLIATLDDSQVTRTVSLEDTAYPEQIDIIRFSPDNRYVAIVDTNGVIRIWDIEDSELVFVNYEYGRQQPLAFSGDNQILYSTSRSSLRQWDVQTGEVRQINYFPGTIVISPDLNLVASIIATPEVGAGFWTGDRFPLYAYTQNIGAHAGSALQLWDLSENKEVALLDFPYAINGLAFNTKSVGFTEDSSFLGVEGFFVFDLSLGAEQAELFTTINDSYDLDLYPVMGDIHFVPGTYKVLEGMNSDRALVLHDIEVGAREFIQLEGFEDLTDLYLEGVIFSPSGKLIATHINDYIDGIVSVYDLGSGELLLSVPNTGLYHTYMAFNPEEDILITGDPDDLSTINWWNIESGEMISLPAEIIPGVFSYDGTRFMS